jgi:hypothetical protein
LDPLLFVLVVVLVLEFLVCRSNRFGPTEKRLEKSTPPLWKELEDDDDEDE